MVKEEIVGPNSRRTNALWRWCCDPVETSWCRIHARSDGGFIQPHCALCGLTDAHYNAACLSSPISDPIFLQLEDRELGLLGATDELWRKPDALGNTPLFFVASRSSGILDGVRAVLAHLICWKGAYLEHTNDNMQNFLFTLNPLGLGSNYEDLCKLLSLVMSYTTKLDFSHRDVHGQTFLHCLVYHPEFRPSQRSVRGLQTIMNTFEITDSADNLGRTISQVLKTSTPSPISWSVWGTSALRLKLHEVGQYMLGHALHPTNMDKNGDTVLLWLVKNRNQFHDNKAALFAALMDDILSKSPRSIHFVDRSGETALFVAVKSGKPRIVRRLLQVHGIKYNIENYSAVSLLSAARDELRLAEQQATSASLLRYCDILICMIFVLDFDAGIPLVPSKHVFRGEGELGVIAEEDLKLESLLRLSY
jgi:ankyrin repeat protein